MNKYLRTEKNRKELIKKIKEKRIELNRNYKKYKKHVLMIPEKCKKGEHMFFKADAG